jgi:hypothetical protein
VVGGRADRLNGAVFAADLDPDDGSDVDSLARRRDRPCFQSAGVADDENVVASLDLLDRTESARCDDPCPGDEATGVAEGIGALPRLSGSAEKTNIQGPFWTSTAYIAA